MIPTTPTTNISDTAVYVDAMAYGTAVHVDAIVCDPDLPMRVDSSETVVHGSDMTVKPAAVKSAVEPTAVEPAMPSASVPPSARVGEIRLAEDNRAQQRSCNAHDGPHLSRGGLVIS